MKNQILIIAVSLGIVFASCSVNNNQETPTINRIKGKKVKAFVVKERASQIVYSYSGIVQPSVQIPVSFQLIGQINEIMVEEGDFVKKGQKLASIDNTSILNSYKAAKAGKQQAEDAYQRLKQVYDNGSLPEIQWEEMIANLEKANSMAAISKENLENCTIVAPDDGIIGKRNIEIGQNIAPNISVIELISIEDVYVRISVPEKEINKLKPEQLAMVKIPAVGTETYKASIKRVGVMAHPISKTYEVKLKLENPELIIKPGMVCDVEIALPESSEIAVPFQAVGSDSDGNRYVYIIEDENHVRKQEVVTGEFSNTKIRIVSGIEPGEQIVSEGIQKIIEGSQIVL